MHKNATSKQDSRQDKIARQGQGPRGKYATQKKVQNVQQRTVGGGKLCQKCALDKYRNQAQKG